MNSNGDSIELLKGRVQDLERLVGQLCSQRKYLKLVMRAVARRGPETKHVRKLNRKFSDNRKAFDFGKTPEMHIRISARISQLYAYQLAWQSEG